MLFPKRTLDQIRTGEVTLAFRRWARPQVRPGTRMRTAIGLVSVDAIEVVEPGAIGEEDLRRAGHTTREELFAYLDRRDAPIHRIELRYAGADPRAALRDRVPDAGELSEVLRRLDRLDRASSRGPWTREVLELIDARPEERAADLAASLGRERDPFKVDVRKLKELGLTESLEVGYRLSPRGRTVLARLRTAGR